MADADDSGEQPPFKKQKTVCLIDKLADEDLANIFKRLPPFLRLRASQVSKRWRAIGSAPWRDVVHLNLTSVLPKYFGAIFKHCPNLHTVFGRRIRIGTGPVSGRELWPTSRRELSSLKLYDSSFFLDECPGKQFQLFLAIFSNHLASAAWEELVFHELSGRVNVDNCNEVNCTANGCTVDGTLPETLKRLQLSGGLAVRVESVFGVWNPSGLGFLEKTLRHLRNLTCLILCSTDSSCLIHAHLGSVLSKLKALVNLAELCIRCTDDEDEYDWQFMDITDLSFHLPKLEVLFVNNISLSFVDSEEYLTRLATTHPTLRILVITGLLNDADEHMIPARTRYPNGFAEDPLPLLHVFLDKYAMETIRFAQSPSDAVRIHPIRKPLPAFLETPEIAPIFDGVWIAAQIKEGVKHGAELWDYGDDDDDDV